MFRNIHSGSSSKTGRPTNDPQTRTSSLKEGRAAPSSQPELPTQKVIYLLLLLKVLLLIIIMFLKLMPAKAE